MSRAERIKEMLHWFRIVFGALVLVDISLFAWLAQNFRSAETVLLVAASLGAAFATAGIIFVNHAAFRRMAELEDL